MLDLKKLMQKLDSDGPWEVGQQFETGQWQVLGRMKDDNTRKVNVAIVDGQFNSELVALSPDLMKRVERAEAELNVFKLGVSELLNRVEAPLPVNRESVGPLWDMAVQVDKEAFSKDLRAILKQAAEVKQ